jgi:urease accessory protein
MAMAITTITTTMTDLAWLLPLSAWLSPAYPVGAYSYSHGLEYAVEAGMVHDWPSLADYAGTALEAGGGWTDLVLLAAAWRAATAGDDAGLDEVAELGAAFRGTAETALESMNQGTAFVLATGAAWPGTPLDAFAARHQGRLAYPVAVGAAAAGKAVPLDAVLAAYGQAFAGNLVSAGLRLVPLGQTDGLRALAALGPVIACAAALAAETPLDRLGTAALGIDFCSIAHETQYTRLFRS